MWFMSKFIKDFLNLSNKTFQESFGVTKITLPRVRTYNVKIYHKREKCRSQVVYRNLDKCKKDQIHSERAKTFIL